MITDLWFRGWLPIYGLEDGYWTMFKRMVTESNQVQGTISNA